MVAKSRKAFFYRTKMRLARIGFTFCLPGRPKVNAGGACGALAAGRELLRNFSASDRIEGTADLPEVGAPPGIAKTWARSKSCFCVQRRGSSGAGRNGDEFAQWMVEVASIGR